MVSVNDIPWSRVPRTKTDRSQTTKKLGPEQDQTTLIGPWIPALNNPIGIKFNNFFFVFNNTICIFRRLFRDTFVWWSCPIWSFNAKFSITILISFEHKWQFAYWKELSTVNLETNGETDLETGSFQVIWPSEPHSFYRQCDHIGRQQAFSRSLDQSEGQVSINEVN